MTKILILRFSSIGDIVLTTPVIRCIKTQVENAEVHFASKKAFKTILENNPYIDKLHLLDNELKPLIKVLRAEKFDLVIDLHNNLRTTIIKAALGIKSYRFNKLNFQKFLYTQFKKNYLPDIHIVERYLATAKPLGIKNDGKGLDYFIPTKDEIALNSLPINENYIGFVIGAKFATKRLPKLKMISIAQQIKGQVVFLGGPEDQALGDELVSELGTAQYYNACGKFNLNQSASLVKQAQAIITHDTGLMHIAAAFQKNIISIWGNTTPALGMYPYVTKEKFKVIEVLGLNCRPCSKIGYAECPKGHFKCMNDINNSEIITALENF